MHKFENRVAEILASSMPRQEKARFVADLVQQEGRFHWVGLYDVSETEISAIAWTGESAPAFPTFPITRGLNGAAVAEARPVVVQDVTMDSRYLTTFGNTKAEAIFPVMSDDGRVIGTIDVESERLNAFGPSEEGFLVMCSALLAPLWKPNNAHQATCETDAPERRH